MFEGDFYYMTCATTFSHDDELHRPTVLYTIRYCAYVLTVSLHDDDHCSLENLLVE